MSLALLILGLILFVSLVVVHEWGHFIAARRGNVDVEEFGIGFPPRAIDKKMKSGFLLSINWLPIGGFVRLKGENDSANEKGSFGAASLKTKSKIMMAGVGMNLLTAFVFSQF
jgi:regulator of sigma E protease